eukprot:UN03430
MLSQAAKQVAQRVVKNTTKQATRTIKTNVSTKLNAKSTQASAFAATVGLSCGVAFAQSPHHEINHHYSKSKNINLQIEDPENIRIFSGRANPELANEIAEALNIPLGKIKIQGYADGEIGIQVHDNVRGKEVYIIQPTCPPGVNDNLMELLLLVSTMKRSSAQSITAVIPYYGYARQDRKLSSRVPISAADCARMLESMGVDRVVAIDLHCGQIQGFFGPQTPCDNLEAQVVALDYFERLGLKGDTTKVISPDAGGVYRAKTFRDGLAGRGCDDGVSDDY